MVMSGSTDRCFVRQLPCLYPFPQVSHLSSPALDLVLSLDTRAPSLARLILGLPPSLLLLPTDERGGPSTTALPLLTVGIGRAAGTSFGDCEMPKASSRANEEEYCISLAAAVKAAILIGLTAVELFRRLTRAGLVAPSVTEFE